MIAITRHSDKNTRKNARTGKSLQGYPVRYRILKGLFALAGIVILSRVMYLQVYDSSFLQQEGDKRTVRYESIPAHRGVIFDRNGKMLAVSAPVMTLWGDPRQLIDQQEYWPKLARALEIPASELATRIRNNASKEFIYLKRQVTPEEGLDDPESEYSRCEQLRRA